MADLGVDVDVPALSIAERDRRWARTRALLADHGLDAVVVAGLRGRESFETYLSGESIQGVVVMPASAPPVSLTWSPFRIVGRSDPGIVGGYWIEDIRAGLVGPLVVSTLRELGLEAGRVGVVGLASRNPMELEGIIPYGVWSVVRDQLPRVEFVEVSAPFALMMLEKSEEELALTRHCARIGELACRAMVDVLRPGVRESEVYAAVMDVIYRHGAGTHAPSLIVRSGVDSLGWGPPEWGADRAVPPRTIEAGDLVYAELMTVCGGMETQQQVTASIGPLTPRRRRLGEVARAAYDAGLDALRPGASFVEVCDAMAAPVLDAGCWHLSPHIHSLSPATLLGHLYVGADRHFGEELAFLRPVPPTMDARITANMAFSFEPNACVRRERVNIGGTVVARDGRPEELNSLPCEIIEVT
ncbi:MAG TPA: M24 family metallopeptidase [Acidimicrobiales bacterium]|nr:M24 family metallopeptidase [Acidimicrobiales bacterium]